MVSPTIQQRDLQPLMVAPTIQQRDLQPPMLAPTIQQRDLQLLMVWQTIQQLVLRFPARFSAIFLETRNSRIAPPDVRRSPPPKSGSCSRPRRRLTASPHRRIPPFS